MKLMFVVFFSIMLFVLSVGNFYIGKRLLWIFENTVLLKYKMVFVGMLILLALSFVLGRAWQMYSLNALNEFLVVLGSVWLGFLAYFFMSFILLDIISVVVSLLSAISKITFFKSITDNFFHWQKTLYLFMVVASTLFLAWGYYNAHNIQIVKHKLKIEKKDYRKQTISLAVASDLHIGSMIRKTQTEKMVQALLSLEADAILLVGDIVDEKLAPIKYHNSSEALKKLTAPLGVFAVAGNHEYIGDINETLPFLEKHNITVLKDQCKEVGGIILLGRDDLTLERSQKIKRKTIATILQNCPQDLPVVLLDHQPLAIDESAKENIDLHISGHTHHGQLWPFHWLTQRMFVLSHGLKKFKNTWVYVSSGSGFWGPPFKTVGRSEVILFVLEFV